MFGIIELTTKYSKLLTDCRQLIIKAVDYQFWDEPSKSMKHRLKNVLEKGMNIGYEYYFGSTTDLIITVSDYSVGPWAVTYMGIDRIDHVACMSVVITDEDINYQENYG